jgi:hypothetical protein
VRERHGQVRRLPVPQALHLGGRRRFFFSRVRGRLAAGDVRADGR